MAVDATPYRDSSSENITLGSVARRRRCDMPGNPGDPKFKRVGDKWVSAICRFSSESGLLRFDSDGGGTVKNDFPNVPPDCLDGEEE